MSGGFFGAHGEPLHEAEAKWKRRDRRRRLRMAIGASLLYGPVVAVFGLGLYHQPGPVLIAVAVVGLMVLGGKLLVP